MKKKILIVVGTRPNFIKITQFRKEAAKHPSLEIRIVHTGQHFDEKMADVFFRQFELEPDIWLNITQGSPNRQMADILVKLEEVIHLENPSLVMVVGDVNSTLAAAICANKCNIPIAHLESGLRSFDRSMPEEHNRILTDDLTDYFFITEESGIKHLRSEGKSEESLFMVGNTMIDTLVAFTPQIDASDVLSRLNLKSGGFVLMTMHRPATVDFEDGLYKLVALIERITKDYQLVFPIHPRTVKMLKQHKLDDRVYAVKDLILCDPLDYFSFQKLIKESAFIVTDSGGIQEESTFLKVPCLTLRPNTERPVTVTVGSNELLPFEMDIIEDRMQKIREGSFKRGEIPALWDGKSTARILAILDSRL